MPQIINTNIMSMMAQRNLNTTQGQLQTALERLSSGLRINSAKDDAAGLAIATRFTTQINGLNQAVRNANDGISLAQTTESALQELTNNLQRIRELAVQSANATNSSSDRSALDAEVQQRLDEITRISTQTSFNGRHVLDGSFGTATFQVGANVGDTISINLSQGTRSDQIGQVATASADPSANFTTAAGLTLASGDLTVSYAGGTATSVAAGNYTTAAALATAINAAATASNGGTAVTVATVDGTTGELDFTNTDATNAMTFAGTAAGTLGIPSSVAAGGGTGASTGVVTAVSAPASATTYTLATGDFTLQVGSGTVYNITGTFSSTQDIADAINAQGITGLSAYVDASGNLALSAQDTLTIGGSKAGTGTGNLGFATTGSAIAVSGSLSGVNVQSVASANDAISRIDAALQTVSSVRSDLGAIQNRFQSAISSSQAVVQNLDASRSRIQDADFAKETASFTRAQVLQQAGTAMVAQANSLPQNVLSLLKNL